ncbi:MAG: DUF1800 domain-containing protein [Pyrinomonadaceae bacterium]
MNNLIKTHRGRAVRGIRALAALLSMAALMCGTLAFGVSAQQLKASKAQSLSEEQRILHVLNRLGFGARPGDVERIKAQGLNNYIKAQLYPEKIADPVAEAKVQNLPTLNMSIAELYEKYPQPGKLLKQLQKRGDLPADLAALRDNRTKGNLPAPNANGAANTADAQAMMKSPEQQSAEAGKADDAAQAADKKDYRQAVRRYYEENGLKPPQLIVGELQASRILRAVYSERQLQEVMVDFWTNHFNVFAGKGADKWLLTSYDRDTIRPHTLGKFEDLLLATAQSPAMLFYLDNFQSVSPNAQVGGGRFGQRPVNPRRAMIIQEMMRERGINVNPNRVPRQQQGAQNPQQAKLPKQMKRGINENYARELMELHTLGVDGGYTQKDVQEVARCFTGWTIFNPRGGMALNGVNEKAGTFYFNARLHDDGEKIVLGHKIPAGGGVNDGLMVLDILAHQPATAKHLATKLAQRFVSDNPSPALVERVAAVYMQSDGDIRETLRAIFNSPEFYSAESYRAKIKQPFELTVSAIRALGGETNGGLGLQQWINKMGQPLYGYQTPNGYADVAEAWVNTGALLERINFGLALASNRIPGTRIDLARFVGDAANGASVDKTRVFDRFAGVILQGDISAKDKEILLKHLNEQAATTTVPTASTEMSKADANQADMDMTADARPNRRFARRELAQANLAPSGNPEVTKIVGLLLGSPEFQRQ